MGGSDPAGTRVASALFGDGVVGGHVSTRLCPPTERRESDGLDLGGVRGKKELGKPRRFQEGEFSL
jgi:hypothetical protein